MSRVHHRPEETDSNRLDLFILELLEDFSDAVFVEYGVDFAGGQDAFLYAKP
jgi:hypothetical protein